MSKVDALRAMREAKYARAGAPPLPPGATAPRPAATSVKGPAAPSGKGRPGTAQPSVDEPSATADDRCGHRNMGGKSCSRPAGHTEKNHRYAAA